MSLTNPKLINTEQANYHRPSNIPQARNPVYQQTVSLECHYCVDKPGRRKIYRTLFALHHHFTQSHPQENYRKISISLANKILEDIQLG